MATETSYDESLMTGIDENDYELSGGAQARNALGRFTSGTTTKKRGRKRRRSRSRSRSRSSSKSRTSERDLSDLPSSYEMSVGPSKKGKKGMFKVGKNGKMNWEDLLMLWLLMERDKRGATVADKGDFMYYFDQDSKGDCHYFNLDQAHSITRSLYFYHKCKQSSTGNWISVSGIMNHAAHAAKLRSNELCEKLLAGATDAKEIVNKLCAHFDSDEFQGGVIHPKTGDLVKPSGSLKIRLNDDLYLVKVGDGMKPRLWHNSSNAKNGVTNYSSGACKNIQHVDLSKYTTDDVLRLVLGNKTFEELLTLEQPDFMTGFFHALFGGAAGAEAELKKAPDVKIACEDFMKKAREKHPNLAGYASVMVAYVLGKSDPPAHADKTSATVDMNGNKTSTSTATGSASNRANTSSTANSSSTAAANNSIPDIILNSSDDSAASAPKSANSSEPSYNVNKLSNVPTGNSNVPTGNSSYTLNSANVPNNTSAELAKGIPAMPNDDYGQGNDKNGRINQLVYDYNNKDGKDEPDELMDNLSKVLYNIGAGNDSVSQDKGKLQGLIDLMKQVEPKLKNRELKDFIDQAEENVGKLR